MPVRGNPSLDADYTAEGRTVQFRRGSGSGGESVGRAIESRGEGINPCDSAEVVDRDPFVEGVCSGSAGPVSDGRDARQVPETTSIIDEGFRSVGEFLAANFLNGVLEEIDEGILDGKLEGISDDLEVEVDFGSGFLSEGREEFAELAFDIDGRLAWEPASGSFEPAFDGELVVDFAAVNLSEEERFAAGGGVGVLSEFAGKFFEGVDDASEDENGMGEIHRAADFVDLFP